MKRLLIFFLLLFSLARGEAQTYTADRVVTKSLYLRDWWVDSVKRDTNFLGGNRSIPTAAAVYNFVAGRGAPGYTSVTSLPDSSGLIFHGPNGVQDTVVFEGETGSGGVTQATLDDSTSVLRDSINALRADIASGGGGTSSASSKDIWVTDMGAIAGDGLSDVTAFRAALYKADTGTIKVVNVPGGVFTLDDTLSIPVGVTLRGTYSAPLSHSQNYTTAWGAGHDLAVTATAAADKGTVLAVTHGTGSATGSPTITLKSNSKIDGFTLYWPAQVTTATPTAYPWAVYAAQANNATVENVELLNAYQGIYFRQVHRGWIKNVSGQVLYRGVKTEGGGDVNRWENIHFGGWWDYTGTAYTWMHANLIAFSIGREDEFKATGCFSWGAKTGFYFFESSAPLNNDGFGGTLNASVWGELVNCGADYTSSHAVVVDNAQTQSLTIIGGHFTADLNGVAMIKVNSTFKGRVKIKEGYWYSRDGLYADIAGSGLVEIDGNTLSGYYSGTGSGWAQNTLTATGIVAAGSGAVAVRGNSFVTTQPQLTLSSTLNRAIFTDNLIAGPLNVTNSMSQGYIISDNAVDTSALLGEGAALDTTSGGGGTAYFYEAQMTGTNGTSLTAYTPETGAHTVALGSFTLNGSGEAVSATDTYCRLNIDGTLPINRKATVVGKVNTVNSALMSVGLRLNGGNYCEAKAFYNAGYLELQIDQNGVIEQVLTAIASYTGQEFTLEAWISGGTIYARINGGTTLSFITSVTGEWMTVNAANGGATFNSVVIEEL